MPRLVPVRLLFVSLLACGLPALAVDTAQFPISPGKLKISDPGNAEGRKVVFAGKWTGDIGAMDPTFERSTLRIAGAPGEADSGLIQLGQNWSRLPKNKGFEYLDTTQSAGGIRRILLKTSGKGRIKIEGGAERWTFNLANEPTTVVVTMTIGDARWCAEFKKPKVSAKKVVGKTSEKLTACPCETYDSTWEAIQKAIFEQHGCTQAACHGSVEGAANSGDLDLRPEVAYDNLINVFSEKGQMKRVQPGSRQDSFLYQKLALSAGELTANGWGAKMPQGLQALSDDELEALRLWIQYGANKEGVVIDVDGTNTGLLLNSCLPAPEPPTIEPPDPPAPGTGVQLYAPPWQIAPHGEGEVCYATYYDLSDQIPAFAKTPCPEFWGGPTNDCYYYNKDDLTQEPNSHHSIIHFYRGAYGPEDPSWGFHCEGGPTPDATCDPRIGGVCGDGGDCRGEVKSALACLGYGPPDWGFDITGTGSDNAPAVGGSQQPYVESQLASGVFGIYPAKGIVVWNSHAFNLFDVPVINQQWWNIYFTGEDPGTDLQHVVRGVFDSTDIFVQDVPPFEEREYCRTITFGIGTRVTGWSSHTHSRGRLFRIWGPGIANPCRSTPANPGACVAEAGEPFFVTTEYNDPTVFHHPGDGLLLDDPDPATRRFKFCSIFDNGYTDPTNVKRNSLSPIPPTFGLLAPGGPCLANGLIKRDTGIACLAGPKKGQPCGTGNATDGFVADDTLCNGDGYVAPEGTCDACPLNGGVTTQDEMFIALGDYYCNADSCGAPNALCDPATQHCCCEGYLNELD